MTYSTSTILPLLSRRRLRTMYPARSSSFRADPMLSVPSLQILPSLWWCSSSPPARTASWRAALWISATAPRCAGGGWTSPCSRGFSQCEIPPWYHLLSAVGKSVRFRGKDGLYAALIPRRGKPMGGGLSADCGRKNMGFSTSFMAVLGMKKRHRSKPMAYRSCENVVT